MSRAFDDSNSAGLLTPGMAQSSSLTQEMPLYSARDCLGASIRISGSGVYKPIDCMNRRSEVVQ
jgi:hypothetical protein